MDGVIWSKTGRGPEMFLTWISRWPLLLFSRNTFKDCDTNCFFMGGKKGRKGRRDGHKWKNRNWEEKRVNGEEGWSYLRVPEGCSFSVSVVFALEIPISKNKFKRIALILEMFCL